MKHMSDAIQNLTREAFDRARRRFFTTETDLWNALKEEAARPDKLVRYGVYASDSSVVGLYESEHLAKAVAKQLQSCRIIKFVEASE